MVGVVQDDPVLLDVMEKGRRSSGLDNSLAPLPTTSSSVGSRPGPKIPTTSTSLNHATSLSTKNHGTTIQSSVETILCGAKASCILKINPLTQRAPIMHSGIAGKFRLCLCPLHNLSGGSEEGSLLFMACKRCFLIL